MKFIIFDILFYYFLVLLFFNDYSIISYKLITIYLIFLNNINFIYFLINLT